MLLGWLFACYWKNPPLVLARPFTVMSLLSGGVTHPVVSVVILAVIHFYHKLFAGLPDYLLIVGVGILAGLMWLVFGKLDEQLYLLIAFSFTALFMSAWRKFAVILASGILLFVVIIDRNWLPVTPVFTLSGQQDEKVITARAVAQVTPKDALFVVPPQFGLLRIHGQRALVVDFKSIPFQDAAMLEWRERMRVVYGEVEGGGFKAARAFDKAYRRITDTHLLALASRYGATHALLYMDTPSQLVEVYANEIYKIVQLQQ
jgi:hypothetical protein